jgi:hypothetical protein
MLFSQQNMPVIHIYNINKIISDYKLPNNIVPKPTPGEGTIFSSKIHNIYVAIICLLLLVAAIVMVVVFDRHDRKFTSNVIDPDEEL